MDTLYLTLIDAYGDINIITLKNSLAHEANVLDDDEFIDRHQDLLVNLGLTKDEILWMGAQVEKPNVVRKTWK